MTFIVSTLFHRIASCLWMSLPRSMILNWRTNIHILIFNWQIILLERFTELVNLLNRCWQLSVIKLLTNEEKSQICSLNSQCEANCNFPSSNRRNLACVRACYDEMECQNVVIYSIRDSKIEMDDFVLQNEFTKSFFSVNQFALLMQIKHK